MGPATSRPLRVVVADESVLVREAISYLLTSSSDVELVASCPDVEALAAAVAAHRPDVVVIDVGLSRSVDSDGVRVAVRLLDPSCALGVVEIGPEAGRRGVRLGKTRRAYVPKSQLLHGDRLTEVLRTVTRSG